MKKLFGVITAMVTPFDEADHVNVPVLRKMVDFLIEKGVNGLYPAGTTGEMLLLSLEERELVAETVVSAAAGRVPVFIHTGAVTVSDTVRLTKHAYAIGADGVGVVTPIYHVVHEKAMLEYYQTVSACVPAEFPIYVYVIPQLAGNDVSPETMATIARRCPNVIGVKYSGSDMQRVSRYLQIKNGKFSVVFGKDDLFLPALSIGCDGTVSGCSNAVPEVFTEVYGAFLAGELPRAAQAQKRATEVVSILKAGADMSCFKSVLTLRGIPVGSMRKPLMDLDEEEKQTLFQAVRPYIKNPAEVK